MQITLAVLTLAHNSFAHACDDLFIVTPPKGEGGTVYLSKDMVDPGGYGEPYYPRKGYLPVGTWIKVDSEEKKGIRHREDGAIKEYYGFTAATGVTGYVLAASTTRVGEFLSVKDASINCGTVRAIVVPVNPVHELPIYYQSEDGTERSFTMSRSAFKAVVYTESDGKTIDYGPESYPALPVQFIETEATGDIKVKSGFVLTKHEDKPAGRDDEKLFNLSFLPKDSDFLPFSLEDKCNNDTRCTTNFIKSELLEAFKESDINSEDIIQIVNSFRSCRGSDEIKLELKLEGGTPRFFGWLFGTEATGAVSATRTLYFPEGTVYRSYDLEHVIRPDGTKGETNGKLYKELVCNNDQPFKASIVQLSLDSTTSTILNQKDVLGKIDSHFFKPEFRQHRRRDAMFVVPYKEVADESYFASFRRLSLFLKQELSNSDLEDRDRVISFLIENLADWYGPKDTLPSD